MNPQRLRELLESLAAGRIDAATAFERIKTLPFQDLGFAKLDHHRSLRNGLSEVIFGEGKTTAQIAAIARGLREQGEAVLITRLTPDKAAGLAVEIPDLEYNGTARTAVLPGPAVVQRAHGTILVAAAGTSDLPVAEEAAVTAEFLGNPVERVYDVGVAGIHRLFAQQDRLRAANVLIVVAGMEGALPSVVGGLVERPVIAVPTSIGYGASFGGLAALLAMMNSCAAGVTVVNIDNGFGAGVAASHINHLR